MPGASLHWEDRTVLAESEMLVRLLGSGPNVAHDRFQRLRRHQTRNLYPNHFFRFVTEHAGKFVIGVDDPAVEGESDALKRGVGQPAKAVLTLTQGLFRMLAFGGIPSDHLEPRGLAALVNQLGAGFQCQAPPVFRDKLHLSKPEMLSRQQAPNHS